MQRPKRRILLFQWLGDMVLCLMVSVPFSLPAVMIMSIFRPEGETSFWASMLTAACGVGTVGFLRLRRIHRAGAPLPDLSRTPARGSWKWLLLACTSAPLLQLMQSTLLRVLNVGAGSADPITLALSRTTGWALCPALAALVLAAPISEELLFRGLLLGRFRAHGYLASGTILSAVIFMLVHGDPRKFPYLFGGGLLLGWLYHRTNSLWPPIALHALNNGWGVIQTILSSHH
jgi:membrane protease YdiL (CAAX protease family)